VCGINSENLKNIIKDGRQEWWPAVLLLISLIFVSAFSLKSIPQNISQI
jgi:hypothetical protein